MGCCFSAGDHHPAVEHGSSMDGAPPTSSPGVFEEETVKEVLLETPVVLKADERIKGMRPGDREWKAEPRPTAVGPGDSGPPGIDKEEIVSEVSQVSEMCSFSESISNATAQEKRDDDDDGVVNQRPPPRKRRAHGGGRGKRERVVARRIASPLPEKRVQVAPLRPVRGRPMAAKPRNVAEENGQRRDAGEGSRRRSRSPVRRGEAEAPRNADEGNIPATRESSNDVVSAEEVESLENPVVSLECFIFL